MEAVSSVPSGGCETSGALASCLANSRSRWCSVCADGNILHATGADIGHPHDDVGLCACSSSFLAVHRHRHSPPLPSALRQAGGAFLSPADRLPARGLAPPTNRRRPVPVGACHGGCCRS